jgi:arsenite methyltransferase
MASQSPEGFDVHGLRERVQATYEQVAGDPGGDYHFHRGPDYAAHYLRYEQDELAKLPEISTAPFAGVGNPHRVHDLRPVDVVVGLGCGAGMDLLLAARHVAPDGRAIGVDMTPGMRERAMQGAREAGLESIVEVREGFLEELPLESESVDVVMSNGVINLSPDKEKVFREIARVLRPGGRLQIAEVVVQRELTLEARSNPELWAACIAGALYEPELSSLAESVGLVGGHVVERFDCFRDTSAAEKVSKDLRVQGVSFVARKPG